MLTLTSKSTALPVTLDVIKHHLRLSTVATNEDDLLDIYCRACQGYAENYMGRDLTTSKRVLYLDEFPSGDNAIEIPRPPLTTDDSTVGVNIEYYNSTGASTGSLATTIYTVDYNSQPARIYLQYNQVWPDAYAIRKAVKVTYKCGYGGTNAVPMPIQQWLLMRVGAMYENREAAVIDADRLTIMPRPFLDGLLDEYTIPSV